MSRQVSNNLFYENELPLVNGLGRRHNGLANRRPIGQDDNMTTVVLLTTSNIFTICLGGHLKYRITPLPKVILISWIIASAEYCFQVPANRIGSYGFTMTQPKTIQEVETLTVFSVFSVLYLKEQLGWNYLVGFANDGRSVFRNF